MLFLLDALTRLLNQWFAAPIDALLLHLGIHPAQPTHPITNGLAAEIVVLFGLIVFFALVRLSLSVEKPGALQLTAESIYDFVDGTGEQIMGHGYEKHMSFAGTIFVFVLLCNLVGLLPGISTPTSSPEVPLGIALLTFVYYNVIGLKEQGPVGYFKHFLGPVWWISPLMLPIEIVSHLARILSLTTRLYANMFASDLLTLVFFSFLPIGIPVIFLGMHFGVACLQAYVFMLLTIIYLSMASSHEEGAESH